jgi:hypothetical protein
MPTSRSVARESIISSTILHGILWWIDETDRAIMSDIHASSFDICS